MPLFWIREASLAAAFTILRLANGQPQIAYPVNSQLPPVAYVQQPFEFVFSPLTFSSDNLDISYALSNQPAWISLDNDTRTLTGTPTSTDLGAPNFQLLASDQNGQTSSAVTLVVVERQTLSTAGGILTLLEKAGSVSTPATLLLHPSESFLFNVTSDVFNGVSTRTVFYAVSADGSPLPSWMHFDPQSITFSGTTLPLLTPESTVQSYSFSLVASDVLGFSESNIDFTIVTTERILAFAQPDLNVSISGGGLVTIDALLDQVSIDGIPVSRDEIEKVVADPPDWLHLNNSDLSCNGIAPANVQNMSFSVALSSSGTNVANTTIRLQVSEESEPSQLITDAVTTVAGTYFNFHLSGPGFQSMADQAPSDVSFGGSTSWVSYTTSNETVHGLVPFDEVGNTLTLNLTFTRTNGTIRFSVDVTVLAPSTTPSASSPASGPSTTSSVPGTTSSRSASQIYPIVLAVVLPTLAVIFLIWIVIMWTRKRRLQRDEEARRNKIRHISSPRPGPAPGTDAELPSLFRNGDDGIRLRQAANGPPRLELPWAPNSPTRTRRRRSRKPNLSQSGIIGPSWDDLLSFERGMHEPPAPMPPKVDPGPRAPQPRSPGRRIASRKTGGISKDFRPTRTSKVQSNKTRHVIGLPQRMSGAGHGAGSGNVFTSPDLRSSWQTTQGTIPIMIDSRPGTVILDAFPVPPFQTERSLRNTGKGRSETLHGGSRPTLRLVGNDSSSSNSIEAAGQRSDERDAWNQLAGTALFEGTATRIIPHPYATTATSGFSAGNSSSSDSRALASGSSFLWTRDGAAVSGNPPSRTPLGQFPRGGYRESLASSRLFDSAVSSDSQWEDEDVPANENAVVKMSSRPWSGIPFESLDETQYDMSGSGSGAGTGSGRPRLADQRRQVSVEATEVNNPSSRSHRGSFRFV